MINEVARLAVLRYQELSVINLWSYIKDLHEFNKYFPYYHEHEYLEIDFLIDFVSRVNSEALRKLVNEARGIRTTNSTVEN